MSPATFAFMILVVIVGFIAFEWRRGWRDFPRLSALRDERKTVEVPQAEDGRPEPGACDVDDVVAEASCGDGGGE